jgi:phosphoglycerate dehydrogenase-like enzyme
LLTRQELTAQPALLEAAQVLYTQSIDAARVADARSLRWVQTWGAGVEWLLTPRVIARRELTITNARGVHAQPIAEHVLGLILMFTRGLHRAHSQQMSAHWDPKPPSSALGTLAGKTLGLLGLGEIGRRTAQVARAFGLNVIAWRRKREPSEDVSRVYYDEQLHTFLAECDFLVSTLPLTADTRHLIAGPEFGAMSRRPFLVNIGHGATIDHEALLRALRSQQIAGAGLDVTEPEPLPSEHPLWREPNVIITPHYSGAFPGYEDAVTDIFVANLQRYLRGEPLRNLVDKTAGY